MSSNSSKVMICLSFFVLFLTAHGFLLDKTPSISGQSGISNQYVTASEFVDETMARHQENEQLRQFVTKALSVLSSQLQQKFDSLEQKLIKCENQSSPNQDSFEQKFNDLEHKYMELSEITTNTSNHLKEFESKTKHQLSNLELRQNTTAADISNKLNKIETKTNTHLLRIEQSQNSTAAAIITRMESKETSDNLTLTMVQQKIIHNNAVRVAMTAHPSTKGTVTNIIIKFDDVEYSVGITNLLSYKTTGKFTCDQEGLYLISASVTSYTSGARYFISLNGKYISFTYIGSHSDIYEHTGAVTIIQKLNLNDQVWLHAYGSWYLYGGLDSTLTIIKIK